MVEGLQGQVAVVTGAARGIGLAIARRLAEEGAHVILWDRDEAKLQAAVTRLVDGGAQADCRRVDVSDKAQIDAAMHGVTEALGRIDILVNAAGIYPFEPIDAITAKRWRAVMAVNLDGPFFCIQAALPHMKARGYGRIINIGSGSFDVAPAGLAHYVASKGGIVALSRAIASEGGDYAITCNTVSPGVIATEGVEELADPAAVKAAFLDKQRIKRTGTGDDIAGAVAYIASPSAGFITAQNILVDGGVICK